MRKKVSRIDEFNYLQTIPTGRVVKQTMAPIADESLAIKNDDDLVTKFDQQEAEQYLQMIYIPTMFRRRQQAIIEDYYTANIATVPLTAATSNMENMGYIDRNTILADADIERLSLDPKYKILASIDGERCHINVLKELYNQRPNDEAIISCEN